MITDRELGFPADEAFDFQVVGMDKVCGNAVKAIRDQGVHSCRIVKLMLEVQRLGPQLKITTTKPVPTFVDS